jgi:hypothetical protein
MTTYDPAKAHLTGFFYALGAMRRRKLTMNQAARLAIMLPSPRTRSPNDLTFYLRQRVIWVERQMQQLGSDYLTPLLD